MTLQDLLVYCCFAFAAGVLIRRLIRQMTGKDQSCNCNGCPSKGKSQCNCNTKKKE